MEGENEMALESVDETLSRPEIRGKLAGDTPISQTPHRSLRQLLCNSLWMTETLVIWLTTLSWAKSNKRGQNTQDIGDPEDLFETKSNVEPRFSIFSLLFKGTRKRNSGHQPTWFKHVGKSLFETVAALGKLEKTAIAYFGKSSRADTPARRQNAQILSHRTVVEQVMTILEEEVGQSMDLVSTVGKKIVKDPSRKDALNELLSDASPLHPAVRSFSEDGHVVEDDISSSLLWVPGFMLSGMWIVATPLFWTNLGKPALVREKVEVKLLHAMRTFTVYLGSTLNKAHTMAWYVPGYMKAVSVWSFTRALKAQHRWNEVVTFDNLKDVLSYFDSLKDGAYRHSTVLGTERTRSKALNDMLYWMPAAMHKRIGKDRLVRECLQFWAQWLRNARLRLLHVAVDSKLFGSDVRFQGSGYSNDKKVLNLLPIVSGEFVGRTSVGDRALPGLKHFGDMLVAVKGSEASWRCALGYDVEDSLVTDEYFHEYHLGNGIISAGWDVKYMICDVHLIDQVTIAWVNHLDAKYDLRQMNEDLKSQTIQVIPDRVMEMIRDADDLTSIGSKIPVMAYRKTEHLIKDIRVRTIGQYEQWSTILLNDAKFEEVGRCRYLPLRSPVHRISGGKRLKAKSVDTTWDACSKEKKHVTRSRRRASKAVAKFEKNMALSDEEDDMWE